MRIAGVDASGNSVRRSFTADDRREAEFLAAEFAAKKSTRAATKITLGVATDRYIASKSSVLSPATVREYESMRRRMLPSLMEVLLDDLTREKIQVAINIEAAGRSPKSVRNIHGLLSAVLGMFRPDMRLNTTLPQRIEPNLYVPSDADIVKLIASAHGSELLKAILLAAFGSLRRSEIAALTEEDAKDGFVRVSKAMVQNKDRHWVIKQPKAKASARVVEMDENIARQLIPSNGRIVDLMPDAITRRFGKLVKQAGLEGLRFHDLRHYQVSILHALGVPDAYIMERGGWASEHTMKRVYRATMEAKAKEVARIGNEHFAALMSVAQREMDTKTDTIAEKSLK